VSLEIKTPGIAGNGAILKFPISKPPKQFLSRASHAEEVRVVPGFAAALPRGSAIRSGGICPLREPNEWA
jgi:hypothetical protein